MDMNQIGPRNTDVSTWPFASSRFPLEDVQDVPMINIAISTQYYHAISSCDSSDLYLKNEMTFVTMNVDTAVQHHQQQRP